MATLQKRAEAWRGRISEAWSRMVDARSYVDVEAKRVAEILKADRQAGHFNRLFSVDPRNPQTWRGATPEAERHALEETGTRNVAKVDPIQRMFDRGGIDDDEYRAAHAIAEAFNIITNRLGPRLMSYEQRVDQLYSQARIDQVAEYHELVLIRYSVWREAMTLDLLNFGAVLAVILDGATCKDTDKCFGKKHGWASGQVKEALKLYVYVNRPGAYKKSS